jgi:hypothetical protein
MMPCSPPIYSAEFLAGIDRTISKERLRRYLRATGQDVPKALQLYEYNIHLSEALYGLLHGLEVSVRNAEHHALTTSFDTPAWFDAALLGSYWADQIARAKLKPGATGRPGKVVAELTFGFWVDLVKDSNHWPLWVNSKLHTAFPHAQRHRKFVHERLKIIQRLRNRVAHHEPVLTSRNTLYTGGGYITLPELLECAEWVCIETGQWMKTHFRYTEARGILSAVNGMGVSL